MFGAFFKLARYSKTNPNEVKIGMYIALGIFIAFIPMAILLDDSSKTTKSDSDRYYTTESYTNNIVCESAVYSGDAGKELQYLSNEYGAKITYSNGTVVNGFNIPAGEYKVIGTAHADVYVNVGSDEAENWDVVGYLGPDNGVFKSGWYDGYEQYTMLTYFTNTGNYELRINFPFTIFVTLTDEGSITFIPS